MLKSYFSYLAIGFGWFCLAIWVMGCQSERQTVLTRFHPAGAAMSGYEPVEINLRELSLTSEQLAEVYFGEAPAFLLTRLGAERIRVYTRSSLPKAVSVRLVTHQGETVVLEQTFQFHRGAEIASRCNWCESDRGGSERCTYDAVDSGGAGCSVGASNGYILFAPSRRIAEMSLSDLGPPPMVIRPRSIAFNKPKPLI